MTNSEKRTELHFKKVFLPQYTFGTVKIVEGKQERELCDCLIETGDCYIVIQIKERGDVGKEISTEEKWLENKVFKRAKKQIKKTLSDLKKEDVTYHYNETEIIIDKGKEILPVIVFFNDKISNYDKLYYSEELGNYINIFNKPDYETMLHTLNVPVDIVNYLKLRKILVPQDGGHQYIFDDFSISLCKNEEEYAQYYLKSTYHNKGISREKVILFNTILSDLNKDLKKSRNSLIETLLSLNVSEIAKVTDLYVKIVESINNPNIAKPKLLTNDKDGIMFIRHPCGMPDNHFMNFLCDMGAYYTYICKLERCNAVIFEPVENGRLMIKGALSTQKYFGYDEQLEILKTQIDTFPWNANH